MNQDPNISQVTNPSEPVPTNPSQSPYIAAQPQKNKKWLLFSLLAFILLLVMGGGGYYVLSNQKSALVQYPRSITEKMNQPIPTPDPTTDWKTYANSQYGFSLQYPTDWTIKEGKNDYYIKNEAIVTFYPPGVTAGTWENAQNPMPGVDPHIAVVIDKKPFTQSESQNEEMIKNDFIREFETITVDGKQGYYYRLDSCAPVCPTFFELPYNNGNEILQFSLLSMYQENIDIFNKENKINIKDADKETLRKMIKTIKLTAKQSVDTTNWKTYTNEKFGVSLKYPPTYEYVSLGPNLAQQKLNKGEVISGTNAPAYEIIEFVEMGNTAKVITLGFYHPVSDLVANSLDFSFDGSCGSQFADKTEIDIVRNKYGFNYREVGQTMRDGWRTAYCLVNKDNNLIVLKVENAQPSFAQEINKELDQILSTFTFTQ